MDNVDFVRMANGAVNELLGGYSRKVSLWGGGRETLGQIWIARVSKGECEGWKNYVQE
jgi:hypothetical protein